MIGELFSGHDFLWTCVWQSTACVVAGLLLSFALRRRPARAHQVLLLAMVAAVAVPTMSVLVRHLDLGLLSAQPVAVEPEKESILPISTTIVPEMSALSATEYVLEPIELVEPSPPIIAAAAEKTEIPWASILFCGWIAASLVLTARLALTFVRGIRLLRRATPLDSASIREAARIAKAKLSVTKDMSVRGSESISSPVIWCWTRKPVFLVPSDDIQTGDGTDWVSVLCHELAHYKRRDHISGLLAELAVCILPWNALLWWAKARLVRLSEEACDDWVVATGRPGPDYAKLLLDLLPQGQMAFVPTVVGSKKELQARVRRLVHGRCGNPQAGSRWAWLATILAACLALGTALAQERRPDRDQPDYDIADAGVLDELDEAVLGDRELAEREQLERETHLLREQEQRERARDEHELIKAELTRHRQELLEQIGRFERELGELRDDQDDQARELQAKLREIRAELRRVEAELGGLEREPRDVPPRESREAELRERELFAEREALQERLHELELALDRLPPDRDEQARELQAELQGIREQIRRVERELGGPERDRRVTRVRRGDEEDMRIAELVRRQRSLQERARQIEQALRGRPEDQDDKARELHAELRDIREQTRRVEAQLRDVELRQREPRERPEADARRRELTEHREQLQEKARQTERRLREQPDSPEAEELQAQLRANREAIRLVDRELRATEQARRERALRDRPELAARVRELAEHREQLEEKAHQIERMLEEDPDAPDAAELRAELRAIREQMRRVESELGKAERGRLEPGPRVPELFERRRELREEARVRTIREALRQLERELAERQRPAEPSDAEARRRDLMRRRESLIVRGQQIKRQLGDTRDREATERLRGEWEAIQEQIEAIERELGQPEPERPEQARLEELLRAIDRAVEQGRYDEADRLEREADEIMRRPGRERPEQARLEELLRAIDRAVDQARYDEADRLESQAQEIIRRLGGERDRPREPRPEGLEHQVEQLRGELMQLREEMQHMRELLQQLLERPRPRRPDAERREREPRPEREGPREGETTEQGDPAIY